MDNLVNSVNMCWDNYYGRNISVDGKSDIKSKCWGVLVLGQ